MNAKKIFWLILGFLGLALGAVGAFLPILPSVPFLLLAAFCFGKSSEKVHAWFIGTKLYKNNLESYVNGRGMTVRTKLRIMVTVTLLMALGFFIMIRRALYIPCAILGVVWLVHVIYFVWGVKTLTPESAGAEGKCND